MANYGPDNIIQVRNEEEEALKVLIKEAWTQLRKTNWDITHSCTFNPQDKIQYPVAKSFKIFYEKEGWKVELKEGSTNFKFDFYNSEDISAID
jgi:hypothetical protein